MTTPRTPEAERLLSLAADHMLEHGISGVSLSGLARGIGSNNRMLLYYFGSKDELFTAAMQTAYARFPALRDLMTAVQGDGPLLDLLRQGWRDLRAPGNLPYLRLFFESFAIAVRDPELNRTQLAALASEWPRDLSRAFEVHGWPAEAAASASLRLLALWRGLQFSLLEGVDVAVLDDANDSTIEALFGGGPGGTGRS